MSTPLRLVALLALCCAGPATAQTAPAERAWTDPPVRGAATPTARPAPEAPQAVIKAPQTVVQAPRATRKTSKAAEASNSRAEPRIVRRTPKAEVAARSRRLVTVRTLTPTRPDLRSTPLHTVHVQRSPVRPVRYGFIAPPPSPGAFYGDVRAQRIRQAEAAGYLVVRRSTVAVPDGRILYGYRPYDGDDADD